MAPGSSERSISIGSRRNPMTAAGLAASLRAAVAGGATGVMAFHARASLETPAKWEAQKAVFLEWREVIQRRAQNFF